MNNEDRGDGVASSSNNNNQQPSSPPTNDNNQQPPIMGPPSAALTAALFADRAPRRSVLQNKEGTGYVPRLSRQSSYDDVLPSQGAFQNIGKRSGQIIVNMNSADPSAFFDVNNNQNFINQQLHKDDQSSVLSLSNITMNDSDSAMSMLSSKTAVTFLSSGDEKSPDENGVALKIDKTSMEYVTSSSEDDTSVKQQIKPPTVTIKQSKKPESPKLPTPPISPVLDNLNEEPPLAFTDTLADNIAPPTPTFDYEQGGLDGDREYDDLFGGNTFEQEPKKQKISETKKTKKYIYEKSSSEEEREEEEREEEEREEEEREDDVQSSDDRENRRGLKSRQQRKALESFRASLPLNETESEDESQSQISSQPKKSLEDSGIGPTQLERSNVDLGQDFYRDEEAKLSQKQTALIGEKYIPRQELIKDFEYVDETDDEEANELKAKIEEDDEDFRPFSEDEDENEILNMTLVSTQNDDVDNGTDAVGIKSINTREQRLRRRVTKPCRFWENERPLPQEAGKLLKVKPVPPEEPTKKKIAPKKTRTKKDVDPFNEMTDGVYKVLNEFGEEEDVKIFATSEMYDDSHIRFKKDPSKIGGYAAIKTTEESAQLSIFSSLTDKGIGVGTMIIKPGGVKPSSNTSTQSEVLYILNGQASISVHKNPSILMKRGSVIHIPPFNSYSMKNTGNVDCKLLYVFSDTKDRPEEQESEKESEKESDQEENAVAMVEEENLSEKDE